VTDLEQYSLGAKDHNIGTVSRSVLIFGKAEDFFCAPVSKYQK
jgi:hypothetical protein